MYLDRLRIADLLAGRVATGETVDLTGWIRTRRDSKGFSFLTVHDGSAFDGLQVIADENLANFEDEIRHLSAGCAVRITGELKDSPGKQDYEVQATSVEVTGWIDDPETYPMQPKRHSREFLREQAHLRPRTNTFGAVARIRHAAAFAIHDFFTCLLYTSDAADE